MLSSMLHQHSFPQAEPDSLDCKTTLQVLIGIVDQLIQGVTSIEQCRKRCQKSKEVSDIVCKSAIYYEKEKVGFSDFIYLCQFKPSAAGKKRIHKRSEINQLLKNQERKERERCSEKSVLLTMNKRSFYRNVLSHRSHVSTSLIYSSRTTKPSTWRTRVSMIVLQT